MSAVAAIASPRGKPDGQSPRSPKATDEWTVSSKISTLSYGELKAIAYRHPGLIYNPYLTEKIRLFLAMELGLQRMALDTIATLRVSPYEMSEEGVTILHMACAKGFTKILALLQERKADLETINERGETPLFAAAQAGHADIVERLIQAGCSPNMPNAHGIAPLQVAALSGHLQVVQLLLKAGVSDRGQTSAAMAHMLDRRGSSHRLIATLLALPAKPELTTPVGEPRLKSSESPKGTDSGAARVVQSLPKSASADQGPGARQRRSSVGDAGEQKKSSGKKRLSKGASEGFTLSKLVDREEKEEGRRGSKDSVEKEESKERRGSGKGSTREPKEGKEERDDDKERKHKDEKKDKRDRKGSEVVL